LNNFELCHGICQLHDSIIGAGVIDKAKLVAMSAKPGTPIPSEKEFGKLFLQTEIIASIMKMHSDFFGQQKFFTLSYEHSDLYFFVLSRYERTGILAVQIVQPYNHEEIVSRVNEFLVRTL
jgi:hypothetical protein